MPQPLSQILKTAKKLTISWGGAGHYSLEATPELLKLAMRVITDWTTLEIRVNETIIGILKAKAPPAMAMLTVLTSAAAKRDALIAAAETTLSKQDLQLLTKMTKRFMKLAKQRNNVAHGTWASVPEMPDGILLFPEVVVAQLALSDGMLRINENHTPTVSEEDIMLYKARDFEDITVRIGSLYRQFQTLHDLLIAPPQESARLRTELSRQLAIA